MSRNVRQKYPSAPVKATKRRGSDSSSSLDLSDDDGYSGVEDISDSEDDDEDDVNAVEEKNIRIEGVRPGHAPRPQPAPVADDDEDDEDDDDEADEDDDEEEEEDDVEEDDDDEDEARFGDGDETTSWAGIVSEADGSQVSDFYHEPNTFAADAAVTRHVRFDVPSSESDSTDTDEDDHGDLFPDIFVSQNSLDPAFRREIEHDPDESSGSGSFWDFNGQYEDHRESDAEEVVREVSDDETPTATPRPTQSAMSAPFTPSFEENLELDGYETDGDTTEEDIPEPPIRRKTRRPSNPMSEMSDDSDTESAVQTERGQPRVGRFKLDRSDKKPIAVLNPLTRKMMIFTPHRRRQLDLSPEQFNFPWCMEEQSSPLLSNSANMMLSAMFSSNTFGDLVNPQTMGPAEAFFPFPSEANTADESSTAPPSVQGDGDEAEKGLDISDFITWGGESSGDEGDGDWEPSSTPLRPSTAGERDVLSHLNSDTVGAFRRNQINQQLILSNQATQDSLAFSGPYNYTALKGLKSDRFDTAGIPLTPVRRQKKHLSEVARSPLEQVSAKRKASGEAAGGGHKKHRSISDVNFLRI
ncbi:amidase [Purpureocillium lavendulum]|uniref:Amidase n=1 Tax=Purpureocillium lavendulum TaxID=1247861 RepID=A0AB34G503_9HYPO|nr:amidase [Purpureocillium lavendulum]